MSGGVWIRSIAFGPVAGSNREGVSTPLLHQPDDEGSAPSVARQRQRKPDGYAATQPRRASVGGDVRPRDTKPLLRKKQRAAAPAADPPLKGLKRVAYAVGMVCVVVMVLSWVAASELTQLVGSTYNYDEPVLLVWAAHTTFVAMTPVMLIAYAKQRRESGRTDTPLHLFVVQQIRNNFGSLRRGLLVCSLLGFMYTGSSIIWYIGTLLLPAGVASAVAQVGTTRRGRFARCVRLTCTRGALHLWRHVPLARATQRRDNHA